MNWQPHRFCCALPCDDNRKALVVGAFPTRRDAEDALTINPGSVLVQSGQHHVAGEFIYTESGRHAEGPGWAGSRSAARCEAGASTIEYALCAALVAVSILIFGPDISAALNSTLLQVSGALPTGVAEFNP